MKPSLSKHIVSQFRDRAGRSANKVAIRHTDKDGSWQEVYWHELSKKIDQTSKALLKLNLKVQDKVAIWSRNMPEWTMADVGCLQARLVVVPLYPTSTNEQVRYILDETESEVIFVGEQEQFDGALELLKTSGHLKTIIALDSTVDLKGCEQACHFADFICGEVTETTEQELTDRLGQRNMDDLFTLIYTSGTTGNPKGVMLDYRNMAASYAGHDKVIKVGSTDTSMCFLPLSHIFERAWTYYVLTSGAQNAYLLDPLTARDALQVIKPTVFCAVPRFYEKIYTAVTGKVACAPLFRRAVFNTALKLGHIVAERTRQNQPVPGYLKSLHKVADKVVFSKIREALGGRIRFMPCGGARLDDEICKFFHAFGLNVKVGYGMTETVATVTCFRDSGFEHGSCGTNLPGVEVRIGENNEIQVKGDTVMRGYYKKPEETAKTFTADGWLHTGDAGEIDENGCLKITDRIKELMKTSNGKYIAPQHIEGTLGKDKFIEQIAIVADARNYVTALIVPAFEALEEYAESINLKYQCKKELIQHDKVQTMIQERVDAIQTGLARFEQVKKFTLLPKEFSIELGEITPTLKLRRKIIMERFCKEIEAMYNQVMPKKA